MYSEVSPAYTVFLAISTVSSPTTITFLSVHLRKYSFNSFVLRLLPLQGKPHITINGMFYFCHEMRLWKQSPDYSEPEVKNDWLRIIRRMTFASLYLRFRSCPYEWNVSWNFPWNLKLRSSFQNSLYTPPLLLVYIFHVQCLTWATTHTWNLFCITGVLTS